MMVEIVVWWLLIYTGEIRTPPVFLPEPFSTEEGCNNAGVAYLHSPIDHWDIGRFACIPQSTDRKDSP